MPRMVSATLIRQLLVLRACRAVSSWGWPGHEGGSWAAPGYGRCGRLRDRVVRDVLGCPHLAGRGLLVSGAGAGCAVMAEDFHDRLDTDAVFGADRDDADSYLL